MMGRFGSRSRGWPERAAILAADGSPLAVAADEVVVGLVGRRVKDRGQVGRALVGSAGADRALVSRLLDQAARTPDQFLPVLSLPSDRYQRIRTAIHPVPGLAFQERRGRRAVGPASTALLVGRVADATAEDLKELGPPYQPGDRVGHGGFEQAFERQLAGTPGGEVRLVTQPAAGSAPAQDVAAGQVPPSTRASSAPPSAPSPGWPSPPPWSR